MNLEISSESTIPLYKQIYERIKYKIIHGELIQGDILPSIRRLSKELELSVITIKRAYQELEQDGYIVTRQGKGCFVSTIDLEKEFFNNKKTAEQKLKKIIVESQALGLNENDIKLIIDGLLHKKTNKETNQAS